MPGDRREFLKAASAGGTALGLGSMAGGIAPVLAADAADAGTAQLETPKSTREGDMQYRILGRTGEKVSIIGVGGSHIGKQQDEQESIRIIRTAIDRGVNFMDNSWDYNGGKSEERMGKALRDGYRQKVFLMTKFDGRTQKEAAKQIDESLKRLQTDHVDLLHFHEVIRMEDPDRIFADDGAVHAMMDAQKAGKTRYVGFTGHKDPAVHLRMIEMAQKHGFRLDSLLMPLNVMDAHFRSFQHQVLPVALREGIGVTSMKSMGGGFILKSGAVKPVECLHYAMNLPTTTVIAGMDSMQVLEQGLEAARTFQPMSREQVASLLQRTRQAALEGHYELFKTTNHFDSTAQHPEWLG
jgi:aryl-alcohol dehydrogenase-like predicted oxidoreductase